MKSCLSLLSPTPSLPPAPLPIISSPSPLTCCPELDLSVTLSPAPKTRHTHAKPHIHMKPLKKSQQSNRSEPKPRPPGQTGRKGSTQVCFEEPVVVKVTPEPQIALNRESAPQQPIRVQKKGRGRHHVPGQWTEPHGAASNQDPGCLERVELNTTLALKAEIESLQGTEFNSQRAIQETLQKSLRTKNLINTRPTEVVNVSRSHLLFTSLVSVDVREDQLISQALQDRLLLAPAPRCQSSKAANVPTLLPFMTSNLLRQKPLLSEEEPVSVRPRPQTHPADTTFDLYRRWRRCEAMP